jgi:hypothetical protein
MGIVVLLILLGAGGLLALRNRYVLDQAVEESITAIREAQNRSISFQQGPIEGTKLWGAKFSNNQIYLFSVSDNEGAITHSDTVSSNILSNITIGPDLYVYFASPFGTPYLASSACNNWVQSTKPSKEYIPSGCSLITGPVTVNISYSQETATFTINEEGDVSAD